MVGYWRECCTCTYSHTCFSVMTRSKIGGVITCDQDPMTEVGGAARLMANRRRTEADKPHQVIVQPSGEWKLSYTKLRAMYDLMKHVTVCNGL